MTDDRHSEDGTTLVTIGVFPNLTEASLVRGQLDQAGIRSWLQDELTSGQLFQVGTALGGLKLQVASDQLESAREFLARQGHPLEDSSPWTCPACENEVEGHFEICWGCQCPRPA